MKTEEIREYLESKRDPRNGDFLSKLLPGIDRKRILGVRMPEMRKLAKRIASEGDLSFLRIKPKTIEEETLQGLVISLEKDYDRCIERLERWLPYCDNWASCDSCRPKVFEKHHEELKEKISEWIHSPAVYTVRFGIEMMMCHFLKEDYDPSFPEVVSKINRSEYYIQMMTAWYFAEAIVSHYEDVLPYLKDRKLPEEIIRMTIQKACDSFRIPPERKAALKSLRRKAV